MKPWMQSKRLRRWTIAAGVLLLLAALAAWNWQGIRIWYHMDPVGPAYAIPPLDAQKTQSLSAARRAELERELFSELSGYGMWNGESRRYQGAEALEQRRQRWEEMAAEGSELAHLALTVLPPGSFARDPRPTLKRLEAMAQQGDAAAMCLYGSIAFAMDPGVAVWTAQQARGREWVIKGAELGHPDCLIRLGGWRMSGYVAPADPKRGSEMIYEALRKGYDYYVGSLQSRAGELKLIDAPSRRLEYCWAYHQAKQSKYDPDLSMKVYINNEAPQQDRARLNQELDQLRQWHPSIEDCIQLTQQIFGE